MKKISVVIPSYNSSATIEACVSSAIESGFAPLEVLVVDDASTDASPRIVERMAKERPGAVRLVRLKENGGPAKARNAGAREAVGDLLFFLDSDTKMEPGALERFARRMEEADAAVGIYHHEPLNRGATARYKAMLNNYFFSRHGVIPYEVFDAARAGVRRDLFLELGGFDETLRWGMDYENEEFGHRLCRKNVVLLDPSIVVRHVFPGFRKLARSYFRRGALWMEIFMRRRRFESGGVTSQDTGVSTICLALALAALPMPWIFNAPASAAVSATLFLKYLHGYGGFFLFAAKKKPGFLPAAFVLNFAFTLILAAAASWGFLRFIAGRSSIPAHVFREN